MNSQISSSSLTPNSSKVEEFNSPLLSPPLSSTSKQNTLVENQFLPNNFKYYNSHINKNQFNSILVNSSINLLKIVYPNLDFDKLKLKFFIVEILRRSKTSIQSLQICCYYIFKIIQTNDCQDNKNLPNCPKKLFLGLIILASKFNQDHNYSFKSWLKICGCKNEVSYLNLKNLKAVEVQCLNILNYDLYINGLKYENWCNILIIFGYDFISLHKLSLSSNEITWEHDAFKNNFNLLKWSKFLINLNEKNLNFVKIEFNDYYINQIGKKIQIDNTSVVIGNDIKNNNRKRNIDDVVEINNSTVNKKNKC